MGKILVIYSSRYGQTMKISEFMAERLEQCGFQVDTLNINHSPIPDLHKYSGIIIGTSVYSGKTSQRIRQFVLDHGMHLRSKVTGLFLVCLNTADSRPQARQADRNLIEDFMMETHWVPNLYTTLAGALNYTTYNFLLRYFMKRISHSAHGPTDTNHDHELTDWASVDQFIAHYRQLIPAKTEINTLSR